METCAIQTIQANSLVAGVYDRMPVIVDTTNYDSWLDPGATDPARV